MPAILPFEFEKHSVRVLEKAGGEVWFVLSDVCRVLEITNVGNAAARLDTDEKSNIRNPDVTSAGGNPNITIINESGLYSLVLTSRKAAAKRFKKWVTGEVLPAIRKTGRYDPVSAGPLSINDLRNIIDQPRLKARRLFAALGADLHQCDAMIAAHRGELESYGKVAEQDGAIWLTFPQAVLVTLLARKPKSPEIRKQLFEIFDRQKRVGLLPPDARKPHPSCPEGYGFAAGQWVDLKPRSFKKGDRVIAMHRGKLFETTLVRDTLDLNNNGRSGEMLSGSIETAGHHAMVYQAIAIIGRVVGAPKGGGV